MERFIYLSAFILLSISSVKAGCSECKKSDPPGVEGFNKDKTGKKLIVELHEECFYAVERPEHKASLKRRNPVGVFEALREKFPRFADRYMMEAGLFIRDLAKAVELRGEAKSLWKRTVTWHADEKLVCKMAF
ncbi:unnamed protein product, partial [Mesorhabditis belari]|uniref:Uncharacterized protein n=1 Tax=Mesorhabditis belari TaxID=2138241 RepID=A0AAF3J4C8_9BILA